MSLSYRELIDTHFAWLLSEEDPTNRLAERFVFDPRAVLGAMAKWAKWTQNNHRPGLDHDLVMAALGGEEALQQQDRFSMFGANGLSPERLGLTAVLMRAKKLKLIELDPLAINDIGRRWIGNSLKGLDEVSYVCAMIAGNQGGLQALKAFEILARDIVREAFSARPSEQLGGWCRWCRDYSIMVELS